MTTDHLRYEQFVEFSAVLTGFGGLDLVSTGVAAQYYQTVQLSAGDAVLGRMLDAFSLLQGQHSGLDALEAAVQKEFWNDATFGPLAQNIALMWYSGQWNQLPAAWHQANGADPGDTTHIVSPAAYQEGLVWRAAGTHPQGAKQPGYGTWSFPPVQIAVDTGKRAKAAQASRGK